MGTDTYIFGELYVSNHNENLKEIRNAIKEKFDKEIFELKFLIGKWRNLYHLNEKMIDQTENQPYLGIDGVEELIENEEFQLKKLKETCPFEVELIEEIEEGLKILKEVEEFYNNFDGDIDISYHIS